MTIYYPSHDLSTEITPGLTLRDPFMIASSHWTATESAFEQLADVKPSAVTLKTTSDKVGGDGKESAAERRERKNLVDSFGNAFAYFVDGPKTVEFWDIATTFHMTTIARRLLPNTVLGLSVLCGEDYSSIAKALNLEQYGYVELNYKYTFRNIKSQQLATTISTVLTDLDGFARAFPNKPLLIKIPREFAPFLQWDDSARFLQRTFELPAGLIVANSRKTRVPPSRTREKEPKELNRGVLVGEHLFVDTYDMLRSIVERCPSNKQSPLVASGGIMDIGAIVDCFGAGCSAVQLCSIIDRHGPQVVEYLREQLTVLLGDTKSLSEFRTALRTPRAWTESIRAAQTFQLDLDRQIDESLKQDPLMNEIVEAALRIECQPSIATPRVAAAQLGEVSLRNLRFAVTRGNVSSFLLAHAASLDHDLVVQELGSVQSFARKTVEAPGHYDLGILPQSALESIEKLVGQKDLVPVKIAPVLVSVCEVVASGVRSPADIRRLYHFEGSSARAALKGFLGAGHRPGVTSIINPHLLPLLRFWHPGDAILAKPPLSRIYGLFAREGIKQDWGPVWDIREPLFLVANQMFLKTRMGPEAAACMLRTLESHRDRIVNGDDNLKYRRHLRAFGFMDYCADLIRTRRSRV